VRGVSRGIQDHRTQEILSAVRRGLDVPEAELPRFPKAPRWDRDANFDTRVNALKTVRDGASQRLDIDPGVLCARDRMEAVARRNPKSREELLEVPELRRWQVEVLGEGFVAGLKNVRA
jgi:ribonuclease D